MDLHEFDFIPSPAGGWIVYAKSSYFNLGMLQWSEEKDTYDYVPNANGKMLHITNREAMRVELLAFIAEQNKLRAESAGNK
jgi:hypothetical protein